MALGLCALVPALVWLWWAFVPVRVPRYQMDILGVARAARRHELQRVPPRHPGLKAKIEATPIFSQVADAYPHVIVIVDHVQGVSYPYLMLWS
jgi:hypothetical protein